MIIISLFNENNPQIGFGDRTSTMFGSWIFYDNVGSITADKKFLLAIVKNIGKHAFFNSGKFHQYKLGINFPQTICVLFFSCSKLKCKSDQLYIRAKRGKTIEYESSLTCLL